MGSTLVVRTYRAPPIRPAREEGPPLTRLLHFEFPSDDPFRVQAAEAYADLAADIAAEDGLIWKVWTENAEEATAGGVCLPNDEESATRYTAKHTERLAGFGIAGITAKGFDVNPELSATTRAHLGDR